MKSKIFRFNTIALLICLNILSINLHAETMHKLQKGETLYSLSRKYGVSVDEIMKVNSIKDPGSLKVGMELTIKADYKPVNKPEPEVVKQSGSGNTSDYTAKKGDTYYSIARTAGISVNQLYELNGLSSSSILKPGDKLVLKTSSTREIKKNPPAKQTIKPVVSNPFASVESDLKGNYIKTILPSEVPYWPVSGKMREIDGKQGGVVIAADNTSFVRAIAGGTVVWTGPFRGFGKVVLVELNGYIYLYGGNDDIFVNRGENIEAGKRIGRLTANTQDSGELYFSILKEGSPVNPETAPRG